MIKLNGPLIILYRPANPTDCCYHLSKNVCHVKGCTLHFALGHEDSMKIFDSGKLQQEGSLLCNVIFVGKVSMLLV
jgi:hypothetical protein